VYLNFVNCLACSGKHSSVITVQATLAKQLAKASRREFKGVQDLSSKYQACQDGQESVGAHEVDVLFIHMVDMR
jgi:hypothetical protein